MTIDGAVIEEQGQKFALVIVKPTAMQTDHDSNETRSNFQGLFSGLPLILASQDSRGRFEYQGRADIVRFLASINPSRIPWKRYTVS